MSVENAILVYEAGVWELKDKFGLVCTNFFYGINGTQVLKALDAAGRMGWQPWKTDDKGHWMVRTRP